MSSRSFSSLLRSARAGMGRPVPPAAPSSCPQPAASAARGAQARRQFGSHAEAHGAKPKQNGGSGTASDPYVAIDDGHHVTYAGLTLSKPKKWQLYGGHLIGGLAWFAMMYRFSNDYKTWLGLEHPWDAHGHGHEEGHAEHGKEKAAH